MLPNFICPGAAKAGTTTLFQILNQHPDIFLPEQKETFFFWSKDYFKGSNWYENTYFSNRKKEKIIGDITPLDMYFEFIPKRIFDTLGGDIKLIFMLRNPAERAFSHYLMSCRQGFETKSFEEAVAAEESRIMMGLNEKRRFGYVDRGFYGQQIQNFLKFFKKENMQFIVFEQFIANKEQHVRDIFNFLEVSGDIKIVYDIHSNKGYNLKYLRLNKFIQQNIKTFKNLAHYLPNSVVNAANTLIYKQEKKNQKININFKKVLLERYHKDIELTENLTGLDLSAWKNT